MEVKKRLATYMFLFKSSWQETFEYRVSSWVQFTIASVSLVSIFYLWNDVYGSNAELLGYSKKEMITYYILITYLLAALYAYVPISQEIRDGALSKYLTRPIHYFTYHYWRTLSRRLFRLVLGLPILAILLVFFSNHIQIVTNPASYLVLALTIFGAINILFLLDVLIGVIEFWMLYSDTISFVLELIMFFLAGALIPLAFLPDWIQLVGSLLPFQYTGAFLVDAFVGNLSWMQIAKGIAVQTAWTLILGVAVLGLWKRGIKRFEAFGG